MKIEFIVAGIFCVFVGFIFYFIGQGLMTSLIINTIESGTMIFNEGQLEVARYLSGTGVFIILAAIFLILIGVLYQEIDLRILKGIKKLITRNHMK